jgi:prefoldin subunit 2
MASQAALKKQQGGFLILLLYSFLGVERGELTRNIDLQQSYQNYKNTLQTIASKIGDIEQETEEHKYVCPGITPLLRVLPLHVFTYMPLFFLPCPSSCSDETYSASSPLPLPYPQSNHSRLVLETLEPLPGDRKCFRMINGVLTERTVKEVVPILKTNSDGLKKALEELVKQYKTKQDEMEKWKVSLTFPPPPACHVR